MFERSCSPIRHQITRTEVSIVFWASSTDELEKACRETWKIPCTNKHRWNSCELFCNGTSWCTGQDSTKWIKDPRLRRDTDSGLSPTHTVDKFLANLCRTKNSCGQIPIKPGALIPDSIQFRSSMGSKWVFFWGFRSIRTVQQSLTARRLLLTCNCFFLCSALIRMDLYELFILWHFTEPMQALPMHAICREAIKPSVKVLIRVMRTKQIQHTASAAGWMRGKFPNSPFVALIAGISWVISILWAIRARGFSPAQQDDLWRCQWRCEESLFRDLVSTRSFCLTSFGPTRVQYKCAALLRLFKFLETSLVVRRDERFDSRHLCFNRRVVFSFRSAPHYVLCRKQKRVSTSCMFVTEPAEMNNSTVVKSSAGKWLNTHAWSLALLETVHKNSDFWCSFTCFKNWLPNAPSSPLSGDACKNISRRILSPPRLRVNIAKWHAVIKTSQSQNLVFAPRTGWCRCPQKHTLGVHPVASIFQ